MSFRKKNKLVKKNTSEILNITRNTRFSKSEILDFEKKFYHKISLKRIKFVRFNKVSNNQNKLDKEQFRIHMGILGIESAYFLSDRIFAMLDEDCDEKVNKC